MARRSVLVVCLMVVALSVGAAEPMVRQLDFLAGQWDCSGTAFASPMGPEHATVGTAKAGWILDGKWLAFSYMEKKTAANPMPFSLSGFMGTDAHDNTLVIGGVDSMGGYSTGGAAGWDGLNLTFTGPWHMAEGTVNGRDVFTKKGERQMVHAALIEMEGKWVKLAEETCTRK